LISSPLSYLEDLEADRLRMSANPADLLGIASACCDDDALVPILRDGEVVLRCNKCLSLVKRVAILDFAAPAEKMEGCGHTPAVKAGYLNGMLHFVCPCCQGLILSIPVSPRRKQ
jgi:hypothetical protein